MRRSHPVHSALVLGLLALAGCSSDHGHASSDAGYDCSQDERGETFTAGMSKTGAAGYTFALMDALPTPPAKDNNAWTVALDGPDGLPATAAGLGVGLFMPDHQHGTPVAAVITPGGDGSFQIEMINMWMPGLWEITLTATDGDSPLDSVVYRFCVDG